MRTLSETDIFEPLDGLMEIKKTLGDPKLLNKYGIPFGLYDYILQNFRGYKYPMAKFVYQAAMDKLIAPILLQDPFDKSDKSISNFPMSIPCFQLGKVAYADISPRASYGRHEVTKEPVHLKITERELYAYMQSALILRTFNNSASRIESNTKLMKTLGEVYSIFLSKAIDKNYPVSSERSNFAALQYLCGVFFFEYVMKFPVEKSRQLAGSLKLTDLSMCEEVLGNLEYIPPFNSVDDFFKYLSEAFPFLRSSAFKYRNVVFLYTKMYGQNAVFAIENLFSFVNMILTASMRIGIFNDRMIDNIAGRYVDDVERALAEMISTITN